MSNRLKAGYFGNNSGKKQSHRIMKVIHQCFHNSGIVRTKITPLIKIK